MNSVTLDIPCHPLILWILQRILWQPLIYIHIHIWGLDWWFSNITSTSILLGRTSWGQGLEHCLLESSQIKSMSQNNLKTEGILIPDIQKLIQLNSRLFLNLFQMIKSHDSEDATQLGMASYFWTLFWVKRLKLWHRIMNTGLVFRCHLITGDFKDRTCFNQACIWIPSALQM